MCCIMALPFLGDFFSPEKCTSVALKLVHCSISSLLFLEATLKARSNTAKN